MYKYALFKTLCAINFLIITQLKMKGSNYNQQRAQSLIAKKLNFSIAKVQKATSMIEKIA